MFTCQLAPRLNWSKISVLLFVSCTALAAATTIAQATVPLAKPMAFDVVSIRPIQKSGMPAHGFSIQNRPDGVVASWQTVRQLIQYAYGTARLPAQDQITGLPDWATSQFYDIDAKMSDEAIAEFQKLNNAERQHWREAMMQSLLADRFQLRIHRGTKQAPIYEMVIAKGGSRLIDAATDASPRQLGKNADGSTYSGFQFNWDNTVAQQLSMPSLAVFLSHEPAVGRPVVDKTGLFGTYNFTLNWSVYPPANGGAADTAATDPGPSIFKALEKVGLKLVPTAGTLDTIVIDHVERPSEN